MRLKNGTGKKCITYQREREREREREMYTLVDFKSFVYFNFDIKIGK